MIASLAGLLLIDTTALRSMAIGAILVVAVSMLAASTLLPALIALLGRRARARTAAGGSGVPTRRAARPRAAGAARATRSGRAGRHA